MAADAGAGVGKSDTTRFSPRVLIAGSVHSCTLLRNALSSFDAEFFFAQTIDEALREVGTHVCIILCDVRFDESRMFNFLHALGTTPSAQGVPVVCCRVSEAPLTPSTYRAIEVAFEALGVHDFIDLPRLIAQHGSRAAAGLLRDLVVKRLRARFMALRAAQPAASVQG